MRHPHISLYLHSAYVHPFTPPSPPSPHIPLNSPSLPPFSIFPLILLMYHPLPRCFLLLLLLLLRVSTSEVLADARSNFPKWSGDASEVIRRQRSSQGSTLPKHDKLLKYLPTESGEATLAPREVQVKSSPSTNSSRVGKKIIFAPKTTEFGI